MRLNETGRMVQTVWEQLPDHYPGIDIDEFVVMPNHVHDIIILAGDVGATPSGCPGGQAQGPGALSLPDVVHRSKSFTTVKYRRGIKEQGWAPFQGRAWQRYYYEYIIRSREALQRIRTYIETNPKRWAQDRENPQRNNVAGSES